MKAACVYDKNRDIAKELGEKYGVDYYADLEIRESVKKIIGAAYNSAKTADVRQRFNYTKG